MVDRATIFRSAYFDFNNGVAGGPGKAASLLDPPGRSVNDKNAGIDFYTCVIGLNKGQKGVPIGYVHWGLFIDGTGKLEARPAKPELKAGYPKGIVNPFGNVKQDILKDAIKRWNDNRGDNFDPIDIDLR
jgi:hypothetical protein